MPPRMLHVAMLTFALVAGPLVLAQEHLPNRPAFARYDESFWQGPWLFSRRGSAAVPLPVARLANGRLSGHVLVMLDDARRGTLRIEQRADDSGDLCPAPERFWINVADSGGGTIFRAYICGPYGSFDVIPVDLVGGPGDELVIVRIAGHSSPPAGHDMKIFRRVDGAVEQVIDPHRIAKTLFSLPFGCARWRSRVFIDLSAPKPRSITLRREFAAIGDCRVDSADNPEVREDRRVEVLTWSRDRYRSAGASGARIPHPDDE